MLLKNIISLALQLSFTAADSTTTTHNTQHNIVSTRTTNDQLPLQQHSNKLRRNIQAWDQNNYGCNPGHCFVPRYQQWYVISLYLHIISRTFSITNTHLSIIIQLSSNII